MNHQSISTFTIGPLTLSFLVKTTLRQRGSKASSLKKEIDAAAIADSCAVVIEHKNVMDEDGAAQLADLVAFIDSWKDKGTGSVSEFSGKRIIGVLAGPSHL
ncbi:hypothetical protein Ndes2526A_g04034 [Nannochloris sp. 'desiccata']